jgi:putative ATP-binding cassette transporter
MVWAAILYACTGSLLSYWVGGSLIRKNAERYQRESELRFSLMRVNENLDAITLARGEADEARRILQNLDTVLKAMKKLVTGLTNLTWVTAGYGWLTLVAPILVAAPAYFAGDLSFGGMMMAAGAFNQVQASLRWFVDNFPNIADWRATLLRVASFRSAVSQDDELHPAQSRIRFAEGEAERFIIEDLKITSAEGGVRLKEARTEIAPGDHVLVTGEPGADKTLLFRALAGLWPWGSGIITRPRDADVFYVSRNPYLPPGSLREILAYPREPDAFSDAQCAATLALFGLDHLTGLLDEQRRWDREMNSDQQRRLAFARLVLQAPAWVLVDEALDFSDAVTIRQLRDIFHAQLKKTAIIYIGRRGGDTDFFDRELHLIHDPDARTLPRPEAKMPKTIPMPAQ